MPKEEWGTKRVCPTTGRRFYDLNRSPVVSPYTGEVVPLEGGKSQRTMVADKADAETTKAEESEEAVVLEEDDSDESVDLGDDVLEEDEESDEVSLDDIADVSGGDDES